MQQTFLSTLRTYPEPFIGSAANRHSGVFGALFIRFSMVHEANLLAGARTHGGKSDVRRTPVQPIKSPHK